VHDVADKHETSSRKLLDWVGGVVWTLQVDPSQDSTNVVLSTPIAVQVRADGQDTPYSSLNNEPEGFGVVWMVHAVPFQDSASVAFPLLLSV
jgi:hypothetical protein